MEALIKGLAPAFAVGIALQALIEWLDGRVFTWLTDRLSEGMNEEDKKKRKAGIIRTIAIAIGVVVAVAVDLEVLEHFEVLATRGDFGLFDNLVAGFIVSMGTDGINQIIKFVEKAKENQEEGAKQKRENK